MSETSAPVGRCHRLSICTRFHGPGAAHSSFSEGGITERDKWHHVCIWEQLLLLPTPHDDAQPAGPERWLLKTTPARSEHNCKQIRWCQSKAPINLPPANAQLHFSLLIIRYYGDSLCFTLVQPLGIFLLRSKCVYSIQSVSWSEVSILFSMEQYVDLQVGIKLGIAVVLKHGLESFTVKDGSRSLSQWIHSCFDQLPWCGRVQLTISGELSVLWGMVGVDYGVLMLLGLHYSSQILI